MQLFFEFGYVSQLSQLAEYGPEKGFQPERQFFKSSRRLGIKNILNDILHISPENFFT